MRQLKDMSKEAIKARLSRRGRKRKVSSKLMKQMKFFIEYHKENNIPYTQGDIINYVKQQSDGAVILTNVDVTRYTQRLGLNKNNSKKPKRRQRKKRKTSTRKYKKLVDEDDEDYPEEQMQYHDKDDEDYKEEQQQHNHYVNDDVEAKIEEEEMKDLSNDFSNDKENQSSVNSRDLFFAMVKVATDEIEKAEKENKKDQKSLSGTLDFEHFIKKTNNNINHSCGKVSKGSTPFILPKICSFFDSSLYQGNLSASFEE
eukprot:TRINITY_DN44169_c0_g1_i1.p1 TRINITY_DN44169_c0_g1~~TRINITY_DN44169_c0_g1_i1.p1  ORF type:complete len:257 (+),score=72.68 TRINITY_DN44169_c0_g1_i1:112-882(+)